MWNPGDTGSAKRRHRGRGRGKKENKNQTPLPRPGEGNASVTASGLPAAQPAEAKTPPVTKSTAPKEEASLNPSWRLVVPTAPMEEEQVREPTNQEAGVVKSHEATAIVDNSAQSIKVVPSILEEEFFDAEEGIVSKNNLNLSSVVKDKPDYKTKINSATKVADNPNIRTKQTSELPKILLKEPSQYLQNVGISVEKKGFSIAEGGTVAYVQSEVEESVEKTLTLSTQKKTKCTKDTSTSLDAKATKEGISSKVFIEDFKKEAESTGPLSKKAKLTESLSKEIKTIEDSQAVNVAEDSSNDVKEMISKVTVDSPKTAKTKEHLPMRAGTSKANNKEATFVNNQDSASGSSHRVGNSEVLSSHISVVNIVAGCGWELQKEIVAEVIRVHEEKKVTKAKAMIDSPKVTKQFEKMLKMAKHSENSKDKQMENPTKMTKNKNYTSTEAKSMEQAVVLSKVAKESSLKAASLSKDTEDTESKVSKMTETKSIGEAGVTNKLKNKQLTPSYIHNAQVAPKQACFAVCKTKLMEVSPKIDKPIEISSETDELTGVQHKIHELTEETEPTGVSSKIAKPTEVLSEIAKTIEISNKVDKLAEVSPMLPKLTEVSSQIAEPTVVLPKLVKPIGVLSEIVKPIEISSKMLTEISPKIIKLTEVSPQIAESTGVLPKIAKPIEILSETDELTGVLLNIHELTEETEPTGVSPKIAKPTKISCKTDKLTGVSPKITKLTEVLPAKPTGFMSEIAQPIEISSKTDKPTGFLSEIAEPIEISSKTDKPTGVSPKITKLTKVSPQIAEPTGVLPKTAKPIKVLSEITKLIEISSKTDKPNGVPPKIHVLAEEAELTGVSPKIAKPTEVLSEIAKPIEISNKVDKLAEVSPKLPKLTEVSPQIAEPTGVLSERSKPMEISSNTDEATGVLPKILRPTKFSPKIAEPSEVSSNISDSIGALYKLVERMLAELTRNPIEISRKIPEETGVFPMIHNQPQVSAKNKEIGSVSEEDIFHLSLELIDRFERSYDDCNRSLNELRSLMFLFYNRTLEKRGPK